jgi:hypothetical protein
MFNLVVTIVHIVLVAFIIIVSVITVTTAAPVFDFRYATRRHCCAGVGGLPAMLLGLAAVAMHAALSHPSFSCNVWRSSR